MTESKDAPEEAEDLGALFTDQEVEDIVEEFTSPRFEAAQNQGAVQIYGKDIKDLTRIERMNLRKQVRLILRAADTFDPLRTCRE